MLPRGADLDPENTVQFQRAPTRGGGAIIPTLRVVSGPEMLQYRTLGPGDTVTVGRLDSCAIQLSDPSVSRVHAVVERDLQGEIRARDNASTNGTCVNGQPIREAILHEGDLLEVGAVVLRLEFLSLDELGHLERVVERLAHADRCPLTGLRTRSYLEVELPALARRCADMGVPLTAVMLDIDHFKRINDTWGHQVGDDVLRGVGRLVLLGVRDHDPCVRYGGEEVLVLLPVSDEAQGVEVAARLRTSIARHDWQRTAPGLAVTASMGVATRREGEPIQDWLARADRALYRAKESGRNRVVAASRLGEESPRPGDAAVSRG